MQANLFTLIYMGLIEKDAGQSVIFEGTSQSHLLGECGNKLVHNDFPNQNLVLTGISKLLAPGSQDIAQLNILNQFNLTR